MASQPISYVKAHFAEVLASVRESHQPVVITQNGEEAAVLQDVESWERSRRVLAMLKLIAMGEEDDKQGRVKNQRDVFAALRSRLDGGTKRSRR